MPLAWPRLIAAATWVSKWAPGETLKLAKIYFLIAGLEEPLRSFNARIAAIDNR